MLWTLGGLCLLLGLGVISGASLAAALVARRWYERLLTTLIGVAAILTGARLIVDWLGIAGGG